MHSSFAMESPQVSFKQVVSRGCGLDIHKKVVVATIDGRFGSGQARALAKKCKSVWFYC